MTLNNDNYNMRIIAYFYTEPLLETSVLPDIYEGEIERIYQDIGGRQQWQQLIENCKTTPPDYLILRSLEELGDSVETISDRISEIEKIGIIIITPNKTSNFSEFPLKKNDIKLLAEIQHNQRSRSIRKGHARNRIKALPPPGQAPYGYRRGKERYIIDRTAAPIVKDFFDHFLLYSSLRGAIRYIGEKYNKKISVTTGQRWLTNPVYRGDLEYQNGQVISDTHTPIISREESAQIDRILRRNRRLPPRTASAPRSLAGLVFCGECQSPMIVSLVKSDRQEYLYLRPKKCQKNPKCSAISYQDILTETITKICQDLPAAVAEMNMNSLAEIKERINREINSKTEILTQLPTLEAIGILDGETTELRSYKLQTEISQLRSQISQLPPLNLREIALAVSIPQFWLDLSESERRFYFREFLRQIQIIRENKTWQIELIFIF